MEKSLGEKIRVLRKERRYSLDKMAELTQSSKSYLWELEKDRIPAPSATKLQAIASVLDVTTSYLLGSDLKETEDVAIDKAFYRKYKKLPPDTKKKMRELINVWSKG
jgi:transcriptional regulator with XRE-family HTH domain